MALGIAMIEERTMVGDYILLKKIGAGNMGEVWLTTSEQARKHDEAQSLIIGMRICFI